MKNFKSFVPILIIQAVISIFLLIKDINNFNLYMQNLLLATFYSGVLIFLSQNFSINAEKFIYIITALLNIGISLQTYSVGSADYTFKIIVLSLIISLSISLTYIKIKDKISKKILLILSLIFNTLIVLFLVVSTIIKGIGGVYTSLHLGSISVQIVLFIIPLFIVISALILISDVSDKKKFIRLLVVLFSNIGGLFILNELGCALVILFLFLIFVYIKLEFKYTVISLIASVVLFIIASGILYLASVLHENGVNNIIVNLLNKIFDKLFTRFIIIGSIFENENAYQLVQARKAIAVGGFWGSEIDVYIPVAESDMAYPYMSLKFGFIACFITVILFVMLLVYGNKLSENISSNFDKLVTIGFLHAIVLQAFITITGSCGLMPLTGIPIAFLSKSGSYFIIVSIQLFYVILCNAGFKQKGVQQCTKLSIQRITD